MVKLGVKVLVGEGVLTVAVGVFGIVAVGVLEFVGEIVGENVLVFVCVGERVGEIVPVGVLVGVAVGDRG